MLVDLAEISTGRELPTGLELYNFITSEADYPSSTLNPNTSRKVDWEDGNKEVTARGAG